MGPGQGIVDRRPHVVHDVTGRSTGSGLDVGSTRLDASLVLIEDLAPLGALQDPHEAVRVAGDVGQHVADRPSGKQRRQADVGIIEQIDVREQPLVGGGTSGDLVVEVS